MTNDFFFWRISPFVKHKFFGIDEKFLYCISISFHREQLSSDFAVKITIVGVTVKVTLPSWGLVTVYVQLTHVEEGHFLCTHPFKM